MPRSPHGSVALACVVVLSLSGPAQADPVFFSASGTDAASIQTTVDAFRAAFGGVNNGNMGPQGTGRREINWDGGGSTATAPGVTPFTVFQNRGSIFTTPTPGASFVQVPNANLATFFGNPTYLATNFPFFSPVRLFSPVGSNITDAQFFIPGTSTPASVSGFGAVFSDVDLANTTSIQFFDPFGTPLGFPVFAQPANNGLSFLGVFFNGGEQIGFARITTGNTVPGPNANDGGATDIVFMDDFIFGEPRAVTAIPEPAALAVLSGLVVVAFARRRKVAGV